jgi:micrococcal nuclease
MVKSKGRLKLFTPLVFLVGLVGGLLVLWPEPTFLVTKVTDGDTIELSDGRTVRYLNLNTPELGLGEKPDQCFAQEAKKINEDLVLGKRVHLKLDVNEMDRFGRVLAYVFVDDVFVNEALLSRGAAEFQLDTVNLTYQSALITAAQKAHQEKKGRWSQCAPDPKVGCQIKGNLDKNDHRWYHLPDFRHYDQIVINLEDSDRWFCTEAEAIEAGFKRARE